LSNFADLDRTKISNEFTCGEVAVGSRFYATCAKGEIVAFELIQSNDDGQLVQIYDASSGDDIPVAFFYAMPWRDIFNGLFSTAVVPSKAITDAGCKFYRVDY
jgi:hypothetical protein